MAKMMPLEFLGLPLVDDHALNVQCPVDEPRLKEVSVFGVIGIKSNGTNTKGNFPEIIFMGNMG